MAIFDHVRSMPLTKAQAIMHSAPVNVALISLVTPGDNPPKFEETPTAWLVVECEDNGHMEAHSARRIADFCHQQEGRRGIIAVHCLMGVSRSPSVANAIAEHYKCPAFHMSKHTDPKARVTAMVRDMLQHKMGKQSTGARG